MFWGFITKKIINHKCAGFGTQIALRFAFMVAQQVALRVPFSLTPPKFFTSAQTSDTPKPLG